MINDRQIETVHELAESYVSDRSDLFTTEEAATQATHDLAIEIQATIEQFFFTQEKIAIAPLITGD